MDFAGGMSSFCALQLLSKINWHIDLYECQMWLEWVNRLCELISR